MRWSVLLVVFCVLPAFTSFAQTSAPTTQGASTQGATPTISGQPIDPKIYQGYVDEGFLPLRGEMSDFELAQKFDLTLPQMNEVKIAVEKQDAQLPLQQALVAYFNSKLPPMTIKPTGKLTAEQKEDAERWLADKLEYHGFTYKLGANANYWSSVCPNPMDANSDVGFAIWRWLSPLCKAYSDTGDGKYAEGILTYARAFYHNARPSAKAPTMWTLRYFRGPWHDNWVSSRLHMGCLWKAYQYVGNYSGTTDADRLMILKMIWEHADWCYNLMTVHRNDTFESAHVGRAFINAPLTLPEFKDTKVWLERIRQRYAENVRDCILDDGGAAIQRSAYNFGQSIPYFEVYRLFQQNNIPTDDNFRKRLALVTDFSMYVLSPTYEYTMFGSSDLSDLKNFIDQAAELYPERADLAYVASEGKKGTPPARTAKVQWHEGWLSMRGDWSRTAPFMVMNYNGSPKETQTYVSSANLNSFGLWANGWPYMTDPGSTDGYGEPEFWDWCMHTRSNNTVLVDEATQDHVTGGGRLENWSSLPSNGPGITYLALNSDAYRRFGVAHRRAVLFVRPDYFLVYDVMTPTDAKPHKYNWQGHFQPAKVTIDTTTKVVRAAPTAYPPLWLAPARPESFVLEQKSGPICTRESVGAKFPYAATRQIVPYVSLEKSGAVGPFAFGVLLYPAKTSTGDGAASPIMDSLPVSDDASGATRDVGAMGFRVRHGNDDDLLAIAKTPGGLRHYGADEQGIVTDAESVCVRRSGGKVSQVSIVGGSVLKYQGRDFLKMGSDVSAAEARVDGDRVVVTAQGRGDVTVDLGDGAKIVTTTVGKSDDIALAPPEFSTKPKAIGKAVGIPVVIPDPTKDDVNDPATYIQSLSYPDMVVVTWKTSLPTNATIEYAAAGNATSASSWIRTTNPEPLVEHRFLLSQLDAGKTYQLRIRCEAEDGRVGKTEVTYTHR